mmetsp:Transcript_112336/g.322953  ORF Transcript_112336/g.322953 Transcript_112336/m.322953 type:complete len:262 (-) Transcript_112336:207-992(-)
MFRRRLLRRLGRRLFPPEGHAAVVGRLVHGAWRSFCQLRYLEFETVADAQPPVGELKSVLRPLLKRPREMPVGLEVRACPSRASIVQGGVAELVCWRGAAGETTAVGKHRARRRTPSVLEVRLRASTSQARRRVGLLDVRPLVHTNLFGSPPPGDLRVRGQRRDRLRRRARPINVRRRDWPRLRSLLYEAAGDLPTASHAPDLADCLRFLRLRYLEWAFEGLRCLRLYDAVLILQRHERLSKWEAHRGQGQLPIVGCGGTR